MRYHRLKLVEKNFNKLKNKKVGIVGCGSIGSRSAELLARWGVDLVLIDFDKVYEANLGTQCFFEKDVGSFKTTALKKKIKKINSRINVECFNKKLTESNIKVLKNVNVVVDATDNLKTRFVINEFCKKEKIPWVFTAVEKKFGIVGTFGKTYGFNKLIKKNAIICKDCDFTGVVPELLNIITGFQVNFVINLLTKKKSEFELIFVNLSELSVDKVKNPFF